jgi:hypothetical protein
MVSMTSENKSKKDLKTSDYFVSLCDKYTNNIILNKKLQKVDDDIVFVPEFWDYKSLLKYNYNTQQLKQFAKHYKLKITGNKPQLVSRIYTFLFLSNSIIKIQKNIRGHLQRKCNKYHGPAFINRSICTNTFDFLSMDNLNDIPREQFFSYKDEDGFIYGFDLLSIYNLINKCNGVAKNPFNTKPISKKVVENLRSLLRISRALNIQICTIIEDVTNNMSSKKSVELRALTLFQNIDALGNYTDVSWFIKLNRIQMIKFIRELLDIWTYRAHLTMETKRAICPPLGNPFSRDTQFHYLQTTENLDDIRKYILDILEKFVNTGIDKDNKCLGAYYVLGALTLVSNDAATSLPWLFQAVSYM